MDTLELIKQVLADHTKVKTIGPRIEALPPDKKATLHLIREYKNGKVEAWLATYLLGCVGDDSGYGLVRELLLDGNGKGYAGSALAKIRGDQAYADLIGIMFNAERGSVRREASHGVAWLAKGQNVEDFRRAYEHDLLPRSIASWHIASCCPNDEFLLELLHHSEEKNRRLGLAIIELMNGENSTCPSPGPAVRTATRLCLESEQTNRRRRQNLLKWIESRPD